MRDARNVPPFTSSSNCSNHCGGGCCLLPPYDDEDGDGCHCRHHRCTDDNGDSEAVALRCSAGGAVGGRLGEVGRRRRRGGGRRGGGALHTVDGEGRRRLKPNQTAAVETAQTTVTLLSRIHNLKMEVLYDRDERERVAGRDMWR